MVVHWIVFLKLIFAAFHGLVSSKYNSVFPELLTCSLPCVFVVPMLTLPPLKYECPQLVIYAVLPFHSCAFKSSLPLPLSVSSIAYSVLSLLCKVRAELASIPFVIICPYLFIVNKLLPSNVLPGIIVHKDVNRNISRQTVGKKPALG